MAKAKNVEGINCDGPAQAGMKRVLSSRFEEMCAFRQAVLDWNDPAGVHDMRVASRRLRGALADFAPYLGKRRLAPSQKQIKQIARTLGEVRDHDVAIMTLERTAAKAPAEVSVGIRQIVELRGTARAELRVKIVPVLDLESLKQLSEDFRHALDTRDSDQTEKSIKPKGAPAEITYREVATKIILSRLNELEKLSASLNRPLKKKPLHNMRIAAKHLRYAIELFAQCWDESVSALAEKVADLQSSLGKLHDCDIWIEDFGNVAGKEQTPEQLDRTTAVWLLTHFVTQRTKHVTEAMAQWLEWESQDCSEQLRQSLR